MPLKTLIEFGLSEKEAKVYLALLELETSGVNEIAKKATINRSSAYVIIDSLIKKGLVCRSTGKNIGTFIAESPDILIKLVDQKIKKQKNVRENLEAILSELKPLHKDTRIRPKIFLYSGQDAINKGFTEIFDEQKQRGMKTLRVYQDLSDIKRFLPVDFIENDVKTLSTSGVKMNIICPDNNHTKDVVNEYKKFGSKDNFYVIPEKLFNAKTYGGFSSFSVYEDKIECFTADSYLIVIEHKEIANAFKSLFDLAIEEARRLGTKIH